MSKIAVFGAGYVGLVTSACLAKLGHDVTCVEIDGKKAAAIQTGRLPIAEPQLQPLWQRYLLRGTLRVGTDHSAAVRECQFLFLCVGTPSGRNGSVNLLHLTSAVSNIMETLPAGHRPVLVVKSTVPVGTGEALATLVNLHRHEARRPPIISNPEFLREGRAVEDFLRPERVVIGFSAEDEWAGRLTAGLYEPLEAPIVFCDSRTAELIKYASNAFLASKISFINEIAEICEAHDVDVGKVAEVIGMDPNVGAAYLGAGLGWGGSCLPKDLTALRSMASEHGTSSSFLTAVQKVNALQPRLIVRKLRRTLGPLRGRTVAVWGLAFKPDCDDTRESPAVALIQLLQREGCRIQVYDPMVIPATPRSSNVDVCSDAYAAASGADAIVLATAWSEFQRLDFQRVRQLVRQPRIVDARNCLSPNELGAAGFTYLGVGRNAAEPGTGQISASGLHPMRPDIQGLQNGHRATKSRQSQTVEHKQICVIGAGWVGLTVAACLAKLGHLVVCVDVDPQKVIGISVGDLPIKEPQVQPIWEQYQDRLRVTLDYRDAMRSCDLIFLCVGTPAGRAGNADLSHLTIAVRMVAENLPEGRRPVLVIKSTVPPGTTELVTEILSQLRKAEECPPVVSNPEFLREGQAVEDFMRPFCIVLGSSDEDAARDVAQVYAPLESPLVFCSSRTAELSKYASNAYLAAKISFINEIAELCEMYSVDVDKVAEVIGMDQRIRPSYLGAGLGWGGGCLPKDLSALRSMAAELGTSRSLLTAIQRVNDRQPRLIIGKLRQSLGGLNGRTIAIWGLAFKPDCDDIRESPALALIRLLVRNGCHIRAYDPLAMPAVPPRTDVDLCSDPYAAASGADAIVLATAWPEFQQLDFKRLRGLVNSPLIIDGRNCLPVDELYAAGFDYTSVGRRGAGSHEAVGMVPARGTRTSVRSLDALQAVPEPIQVRGQ